MAKVITDNQHYVDIASAIRTKNETDVLYKPSEMATAILAIKGGVELNFDVVGGTTKPSNPKENTIWANTSTAITGWGFGAKAERPASPSAGMVWFATTENSDIKFDALKEDSIIVTPAMAYQYISGAWKSIYEVKIYQSGAWIDWIPDGALYWKGNQMTSLTGGWAKTCEDSNPSGGYVWGTASFNSNGITLDALGSDATSEKRENITVYTTKTIDVSKYSSITIKVTSRSGKTNGDEAYLIGAYMALSSSVDSSVVAASLTKVVGITGTGTFSIDLSGTSGYYAVLIQCYRTSVTFTEVVLNE